MEEKEAQLEYLIIKLRSDVEEMYLSKEHREKTIQEAVKILLKQKLEENKISSTEYQKALDILKKYEIETVPN